MSGDEKGQLTLGRLQRHVTTARTFLIATSGLVEAPLEHKTHFGRLNPAAPHAAHMIKATKQKQNI